MSGIDIIMRFSPEKNNFYVFLRSVRMGEYLPVLSFLFLYLFSLFFICINSGSSYFSVDSWSYFELSGKVFSDSFYSFNTIRSYVPFLRSSSFPFGYPIVLGIFGLIYDAGPYAAIMLNVIISACSVLVLFVAMVRLGIWRIFSLFLCVFCFCFPGYVNEVVSGRSIPLCVFIFSCSVLFFSMNMMFISGVLIGSCALVRFDFLFFMIVLLIIKLVIFVIFDRKKNSFLMFALGCVFGVLPWVSFSLLHFKSFWYSDNGWVVLSSVNSYVLDFPAVSASTVFDDFSGFFVKTLWNCFYLLSKLFKVLVVDFFACFVLYFIVACNVFLYLNRKVGLLGGGFLFLFFVSVWFLPYVLSGYFDSRYFVFYIMFTGVLLFAIFSRVNMSCGLFYKYICGFCSVFVFTKHILFVVSMVEKAPHAHMVNDNNMAKIAHISFCHKGRQDFIYVFRDHLLAAQYGALTGNLTALLPSNYDRMSDNEKLFFFDYLGHGVMIDDARILMADLACPVQSF